ncbi:MAG: sulfite exporter TauE/SafE family protein [Bacteroidales bacterium]|nr:sulfite exporter TauE/SafE family protein [Bacteroidales bacterium]
MINEILILIIIGFVAGILGGMLGVGGGIIVIPALVFFLGLTQKQANATSLAFMLAPTGLLAVINYYKAGYVNVKYAIILSIAFFVGAYFGSLWAIKMPVETLRKIFALFIIVVGIKLFFSK